jgi:hypothetical protein
MAAKNDAQSFELVTQLVELLPLEGVLCIELLLFKDHLEDNER